VSPQASTTAPTVDLDLSDPDFVADPYPTLGRLRQVGPVVRQASTGMLLVGTHAAVGAALRDRRLGRIWRDREPAATYAAFNALHSHQMMENEPPRHTRLRRLVAGAFARGHVQRMRPGWVSSPTSCSTRWQQGEPRWRQDSGGPGRRLRRTVAGRGHR
jgi:cytochrome P450